MWILSFFLVYLLFIEFIFFALFSNLDAIRGVSLFAFFVFRNVLHGFDFTERFMLAREKSVKHPF